MWRDKACDKPLNNGLVWAQVWMALHHLVFTFSVPFGVTYHYQLLKVLVILLIKWFTVCLHWPYDAWCFVIRIPKMIVRQCMWEMEQELFPLFVWDGQIVCKKCLPFIIFSYLFVFFIWNVHYFIYFGCDVQLDGITYFAIANDKRNKLVKAYNIYVFKIKVTKKWPTVVSSLMLIQVLLR